MSFIQRIFNTKKVQEAKELINQTTKKAKDLAKEADKDLNISDAVKDLKEKASDIVDDVKEDISEFDEKIGASEKFDQAKEKISEVAEKAGDKIEAVLDDKISFDTFLKTEIKVGEVIKAEEVEKSDKLLKLTVSFGEDDTRQIISGIKKSYSTDDITGKKAVFVTNLEPRKIMGLESNGMILGVSDNDTFSILSPEKSEIPAGTQAS